MKTFNLTGELRLGSRWNKFSKEIPANDENHAKELLFARFGSKHKLPRRFINLLGSLCFEPNRAKRSSLA